jgi:hypothetical protein
MDRVHGAVDRRQHRSTVDRGQRARQCAGAGARWSSPVLADDGGGGRADRGGAREVLTGDGGVAEGRRTGGNERRRLELIARAKEGAKELGREGMRCGAVRAGESHRPFIGAEGAPERGGRGE